MNTKTISIHPSTPDDAPALLTIYAPYVTKDQNCKRMGIGEHSIPQSPVKPFREILSILPF